MHVECFLLPRMYHNSGIIHRSKYSFQNCHPNIFSGSYLMKIYEGIFINTLKHDQLFSLSIFNSEYS